MEYLAWIEGTPFSTWMRESALAFFSSLILHSLAMGFVVGVHVATALRILGVAPGIPLSLMRRFSPVLWVGLVVVVLSGFLLLAAYPAKALTNPVFYLKLAAVVAALFITKSLANGLFGHDPLSWTLTPCGRRSPRCQEPESRIRRSFASSWSRWSGPDVPPRTSPASLNRRPSRSSNWVAQADRDAGRRTDGPTTAERAELTRLRRENRQLKVERDILSKAAAWFAQETAPNTKRSSGS